MSNEETIQAIAFCLELDEDFLLNGTGEQQNTLIVPILRIVFLRARLKPWFPAKTPRSDTDK
jgi:hypothetical protein